MTDKDNDLIVRLIAAGKNTYKDLRTALPHIEPKIWASMGHPQRMSPDDVACLDIDVEYTEAITGNYTPKDNATFRLTTAGENILYKLNRRDAQDALSHEAIELAKEANRLSETANKKADVSNKIAADSNDTSEKALDTSKDSRNMAKFALVISILNLLYTIFGK